VSLKFGINSIRFYVEFCSLSLSLWYWQDDLLAELEQLEQEALNEELLVTASHGKDVLPVLPSVPDTEPTSTSGMLSCLVSWFPEV